MNSDAKNKGTDSSSCIEDVIESQFIEKQNNRIPLGIKIRVPKGDLLIDSIKEGIVIDHIEAGKGKVIAERLDLYRGEYPVVLAHNLSSGRRGRKDVIKVVNGSLDEMMIKIVGIISPNSTFNIIKGNKIVEKFKALVCESSDCSTRDLEKDVPSIFCLDTDDVLVCYHCGTVYKKEFEEKQRYVVNLKGDKYLWAAEQEINKRFNDIRGRHTMTGEDFSFLTYVETLKRKKKSDEFLSSRYEILMMSESDRIRMEITEEKIKYLKDAEELALKIHEYVLESFFLVDYDRDRKCSWSDLKLSVEKRLDKIDLRNGSLGLLMNVAFDFGAKHFTVGLGRSDYYTLKPEIESKKDRLIDDYRRRFKRSDIIELIKEARISDKLSKISERHKYIMANMLKAIDYAVNNQ